MLTSFSLSGADDPGDSDTACCMPVTTMLTAGSPGAHAAGKTLNLCVVHIRERGNTGVIVVEGAWENGKRLESGEKNSGSDL